MTLTIKAIKIETRIPPQNYLKVHINKPTLTLNTLLKFVSAKKFMMRIRIFLLKKKEFVLFNTDDNKNEVHKFKETLTNFK